MKTTKNTIFLVKVFLGYCNYHFPDVRKMIETSNWLGITKRYLPPYKGAFSTLKHPPLGEH